MSMVSTEEEVDRSDLDRIRLIQNRVVEFEFDRRRDIFVLHSKGCDLTFISDCILLTGTGKHTL